MLNSRFTVTYEVRQGDPNLYVHIVGQWLEYWAAERGVPVLRFLLPIAAGTLRARYEIPFGEIERSLTHGEEVPALRWAAVEGAGENGPAGCLLINDSKHGYSVTGNRLNLTLIRSTHEPDPLPDVGRHEMHLALRPLGSGIAVEEAMRAAQRFDHEPSVVSTGAHVGGLPVSARLVHVSGACTMSSLKKAESGDGYVARLVNPTDVAQRVEMTLEARFWGRVQAAEGVDVLERPDGAPVQVEGNTVACDVAGRGVQGARITVRRWGAVFLRHPASSQKHHIRLRHRRLHASPHLLHFFRLRAPQAGARSDDCAFVTCASFHSSFDAERCYIPCTIGHDLMPRGLKPSCLGRHSSASLPASRSRHGSPACGAAS